MERTQSPPVVLGANLDGPPLDPTPHEFFNFAPISQADDLVAPLPGLSSDAGRSGSVGVAAGARRSFSPPPVQPQMRSVSNPATMSHPTRTNPVLLPSRAPGNVKDLAKRIDQGAATGGPVLHTTRLTQDRARRPMGKSEAQGSTRLQRRRPAQPRSPEKPSAIPFHPASSFSSEATITSAKSQPHLAAAAAASGRNVKTPAKQTYASARPLFGELTADGWHGNFHFATYGPLPPFEPAPLRQSARGVALGHGRSRSHQDITRPTLSPPKTLNHKRSRSEVDAFTSETTCSSPTLHAQNIPHLYPTPPDSGPRYTWRKASPTSRIPISSRRQSDASNTTSPPYSRSASAMSSRGTRSRLSRSPARQTAAAKENASSSIPRSRYQPPPMSLSNNKTLSAKIVAPLPKNSPPLRSSRPRQPVTSATTSASRARAAERFQHPALVAKDTKRPSEQWLGKPYDPQKERSRRRIPELQKVDFAERRARIQKAISQNIEETKALEQSRERSGSRLRQVIREDESEQIRPGAETSDDNGAERNQADEINRETDQMERDQPASLGARGRGLSLDTTHINAHGKQEPEPVTAATEFEVEESPVLGYAARDTDKDLAPSPKSTLEAVQEFEAPKDQSLALLSSATYQPQSARPESPPPVEGAVPSEEAEVQDPSLLDNVIRMRTRSDSSASRAGTEFAEDSPSAEESPSDLEDRWGLERSLGNQGSIRIMLDDDPTVAGQHKPWSKPVDQEFRHVSVGSDFDSATVQHAQDYNQHAFTANGLTESPVEGQFEEQSLQDTPRKQEPREDTLKVSANQDTFDYVSRDGDGSIEGDPLIAQAIDQYQSTGVIAPEMLKYLHQHHSVDLQRISANGGSDALMVQSLLDSMLNPQPVENQQVEQIAEVLMPSQYELPSVTPDTPSDAEMAIGTAVVYSSDASYDNTPEEEDDFAAKIRKADEDWERQQHGGNSTFGAEQDADDDRPTPPPKDDGYTPHSSTGSPIATFLPNMLGGLRISTVNNAHDSARDLFDTTPKDDPSSPTHAPPVPGHAPPPVPSPLTDPRLPPGLSEASCSERDSTELSPRVRKTLWGPSGSSRPSMDSQQAHGSSSLPGGQSMSSFAGSTRHSSVDNGNDGQARLAKAVTSNPDQKRLMKRRHIIKELVDTENTYHQDLKIIEDIYKATAADLLSAEDRKTLFGNCDEIERFSIHFYDELRRAVATVYVPPKGIRWGNKRGSYSTTQSDGTGQTSMSTDPVDEGKDRITSVGSCFLANLQRMDQVYGAYLKNHDAANQRLSALKSMSTVKCWLDECHNNASDITSAWDLDSLLVKPTQRVSKYPMLLQQLLETTPTSHPDHEALKAAAKDSIGMLTRINEAKKRADIVDQIINRKSKEEFRTGLAKAFGRRTEKLKERVGIAEAFQDVEFDELSHKFGGHFIRLQICMRDVQDYLHRIDKTMDQIVNCASAFEHFTDVMTGSLPEIEKKWRNYSQCIVEVANVAYPEHKAAVQKRVIQPMVTCIKLHEGPQNAINKRKKRIVDYAKCKSIEKRGERPDKKTLEASEMYEALNEQLKIELPQLYTLTAHLVQACLNCFLDIQQKWYNMWERKLRPVLEDCAMPTSIQQIEPAFQSDFSAVKNKLVELSICNGALLADSANFLSPTSTLVDNSENSSLKQPSTNDKRTMSVGSEQSPFVPNQRRRPSSGYGYDGLSSSSRPHEGRIRSNSALSSTVTPTLQSRESSNRQYSTSTTPTSSISASRPATANAPSTQATSFSGVRPSVDTTRSPRPASQQTYFTALPDHGGRLSGRGSSIFNSAMPPDSSPSLRPTTPNAVVEDPQTMFVCASLFEFSIDKTRKEAGYPYLTYVQGEVFDVIAQKGELWLAKNQDDATHTLGWIWEQHFVILSQN